MCQATRSKKNPSEPNSTLQKGGDEHVKTTPGKFCKVDHKAQKVSKEAEYKQLQEEEHFKQKETVRTYEVNGELGVAENGTETIQVEAINVDVASKS